MSGFKRLGFVLLAMTAAGAGILTTAGYLVSADTVRHQAMRHRVPMLYVNQVGGNDQLIFDGRTLGVDAQGNLIARGSAFEEELLIVEAYFGKIGASSIHLHFEVHRAAAPEVVVATGKYVLVAVKRGEFKPAPVPDLVREKLAPYVE